MWETHALVDYLLVFPDRQTHTGAHKLNRSFHYWFFFTIRYSLAEVSFHNPTYCYFPCQYHTAAATSKESAVTFNVAMVPPAINDTVPFASYRNLLYLILLFLCCLKLHNGSSNISLNFPSRPEFRIPSDKGLRTDSLIRRARGQTPCGVAWWCTLAHFVWYIGSCQQNASSFYLCLSFEAWSRNIKP